MLLTTTALTIMQNRWNYYNFFTQSKFFHTINCMSAMHPFEKYSPCQYRLVFVAFNENEFLYIEFSSINYIHF